MRAASATVRPDPSGAAGDLFAFRRHLVSLVDADPDLVERVPAAERAAVGLAARVEPVDVAKGPWDPPDQDGSQGLGIFVLSGFLARTVSVGRRESLELVGPGDLIRPGEDEEHSLLGCDVRWEVLAPVTIAELGLRFSRSIAAWPALTAAISGRGLRRTRQLAMQAAIDAHPAIEERLMLLLCLLADRYGRVCSDGVLLDLPLNQRHLAGAVSALRPSTTAALSRLRRDGRLIPRSRGQWLITGTGRAYVDGLCSRDPAST